MKYKLTVLANWLNEPTSCSSENVIQHFYVDSTSPEDALKKLNKRFQGTYEIEKFSLIKAEEKLIMP